MDKTVCFYCVAPVTYVTKNNISGRKNAKKRLTIALAGNADSSFKLPLLFVGTARQPRCFEGKMGKELGWLRGRPERSEGHHALLILDNAFCHRADEQLSNTQPQYADIIWPFKAQINILKNQHYINAFADTIERSNALVAAMRWAQQAWESVTKSTVANCWRHTWIIGEGLYEPVQSMEKIRLDAPSIQQLVA